MNEDFGDTVCSNPAPPSPFHCSVCLLLLLLLPPLLLFVHLSSAFSLSLPLSHPVSLLMCRSRSLSDSLHQLHSPETDVTYAS
ncbi:unnamed protein product [Protopolystoma xenopodis]|uniref:Uncharacterized protein n=1 Tax=Protopolystoma xenopodis TaxID=117903 RepID=A0A3S5BZE6_9PLAT|nr:unnamed protein product [Protopolystoma xenopodis]